MAEEKHVFIKAWPAEPAPVRHEFNQESPCPVSISFNPTPASVVVRTPDEQPLQVDMAMDVTAERPFPVCIQVCQPICADSKYRIGVTIFDRPVADITVAGLTRLFNCGDTQPPKQVCVDFKNLELGETFESPFLHQGLKFVPLDAPLRAVAIGEPVGQTKLSIPPEGTGIEFPQPVDDVELTVNNYAGRTLRFTVKAEGQPPNEFEEVIENTVKVVKITTPRVQTVTIRGGANEASLVQVCFTITG